MQRDRTGPFSYVGVGVANGLAHGFTGRPVPTKMMR
jgi:hypothetical protein